MIDEILTLKEVAKYLKLVEKTAYRLAAEGKLPCFKVDGGLQEQILKVGLLQKKILHEE